jgi:hypothetical protein
MILLGVILCMISINWWTLVCTYLKTKFNFSCCLRDLIQVMRPKKIHLIRWYYSTANRVSSNMVRCSNKNRTLFVAPLSKLTFTAFIKYKKPACTISGLLQPYSDNFRPRCANILTYCLCLGTKAWRWDIRHVDRLSWPSLFSKDSRPRLPALPPFTPATRSSFNTHSDR